LSCNKGRISLAVPPRRDLEPPHILAVPPRRDLEPPHIEPTGRGPAALALVGALLALLGLVMTIPLLVEPWPDPGFRPPSGWQQDLWAGAFFVGTPSLVLAIVALVRQKRRRRAVFNARSRIFSLPRLALGLSILGACVWSLPVCVQAGEGL
jgi:hypothetical protein